MTSVETLKKIKLLIKEGPDTRHIIESTKDGKIISETVEKIIKSKLNKS